MEFIKGKELCRRLQISRNTLGEWRKAGMPYTKLPKCAPRYSMTLVLDWLSQQSDKPQDKKTVEQQIAEIGDLVAELNALEVGKCTR